jgi:succinyl-CoA synthetase alpha subunit
MSIIVDENTKVMVQGITGREGTFHTRQMVKYGTKVVAGMTPGKGGTKMDEIPVFNTCAEAVHKTGADASMILVPAQFAADSALEAIDAGCRVVVVITEGIPIQQMIEVWHRAKAANVTLIGPNCPGIISTGKCKIGILPQEIVSAGPVGLVSRSGTLTYEIVDSLTRAGIGQTTTIGVGGDPIIGTTFKDVLRDFDQDPETRAIILVGEIGGNDEQEAAEIIRTIHTPVVGFIGGRTAPPGKRMGHAGAIVSGKSSTAEAKVEALRAVGVPVCDTVDEIIARTREVLGQPAGRR